MRHLVLLLLLLCYFRPITFAQNSEDCVDAHVLAPTTTLLSDVPDVTVDELLGGGTEPLEWFTDNEDQCGTERTFIAQPTDKSYWFVFSAETAGDLEFMITPEAPGTTYDFAIWRGGCPNDLNCSELYYCAWGVGAFDCSFLPTGVTPAPQANFNVAPNLAIYEETVSLEAGENYYLLVQNTDESNSGLCPAPSDSLGFTIEFGGTATIGPEIIHTPPIALTPLPNTDTLFQCAGDELTFAISQVPNASTYDWFSQSTVPDATIVPNALGDSATVTFGTGAGKICMEIICPVQTIICWDIQVDEIPDLVVIPNDIPSCEPVDLVTRFQDNNANATGTVAYYETAEDVMQEINPLTSSMVSISGNYWARKTTPNGCFDIVQMTVLVDNIAISVIDTFRVCTQTFVDLADELPIQSLNGNVSNLVFSFFEDSLRATNPNSPPILPPVVFTDNQYWVRAESQNGGPCFDVKPFVVIFDTALDIAPIPAMDLCGNTCFQLLDLPLNSVDGTPLPILDMAFYNNEGDALAGEISNTINTEICTSGTYWARVSSSATCSTVKPFTINFSPTPDIDDLTLTIDCQSGGINLAELILTEKNGIDQADLFYSYFTSQAAANDPNATPLTLDELFIFNPTEIWVNLTNLQNGCFDVAQITIAGMPLATANLSGDQAICAGGAAVIDINFTGDAPFNLRYTDEVSFFDTIVNTNTFALLVTPASTRTYSISSFMDSNGCVGNALGTADISIIERPIIENLTPTCNATNTDYTLSFDIIGNDTYTVEGITGTLTGNTFTSDLIPSGNSFTLQVSGSGGCPAVTENIAFSCECNAVVDIMDTQPINVCDRAPAIGSYLGPGGENLDGGTRFFVLHDSPMTTLGNIVGYETVPIFIFDEAVMQHGITYYMSAVITRTDGLGNPILDINNNPCLVTSVGAPVIFYPIPAISLGLSSPTICQGESVNLTFNIEGVGPFDVIFFNGSTLVPLMDIEDGHTISLSPEFSTSFYVQSISQSGLADCSNMPIMGSNELELTVFGVPTIQNVVTNCNNEGSMLVLSFEVIDGDQATYMVDGIAGIFKGNEFTSDSIPHNTPYEITVSDINNCPTIPIIGVAECLCTSDIAVNIITLKDISCRGEKDGILSAIPINGVAPYTYLWSTGATTQNASGIAPGMTTVSVTDANGCLVTNEVSFEEPTSITTSINTLDPSCFETNDGAILFVQVEGGTGTYSYSFNNSQFRAEGLRENLASGVYPVAVQDENGCQWTGEATLNNPPQFDVSLGADVILDLGDSITLNPQINEANASIEWESEDATLCSGCLNPTIKPMNSERYKITAINSAGCIASDVLLVQVQNQQRLFIPSAFSPDGDGVNDILHPFSGPEVRDIPMFRIFNRWGELVYENTDMTLNSGLAGWNGTTLTGEKAPSGVYIYYAEVHFRNGTMDINTGDVTLVR